MNPPHIPDVIRNWFKGPYRRHESEAKSTRCPCHRVELTGARGVSLGDGWIHTANQPGLTPEPPKKMLTTEQKLKAILVLQLAVHPEDLRPESRLAEDFGADSLDRQGLIYDLEDAFGLTLDEPADEAALEEVKTFGDLLKFVESKL